MYVNINGTNQQYQINESGVVVSFKRATRRVMKIQQNQYGYKHVGIIVNNVKKTIPIHVLVMEHFKECAPSLDYEIDHKDDDRNNNHVDNLEWISKHDNLSKSHKVVGRKYSDGVKNKLSDDDRLSIINHLKSGASLGYIANIFGVSRTMIHKIKKISL